jgi:tetratricopeptide (TPR) repeat protein
MDEMERALRGITASCLLAAASVMPSLAAECGNNAAECAAFHISRQEFAQAIPHLQQNLKAAPHNVKVMNLLGLSYTATGQIEKANEQFRAALKVQPSFYAAEKNLAVNEFGSGHLAAAKEHFERVLQHVPLDEVSHFYLGEIAFVAKDCAAALSHYDKSRTRIVNNPDLIFRYAFCALDRQRAPAAATMLELLPPGDGHAHFRAGQMLGKAGLHREAAKHFALARPAYPEPQVAGYNQILMLLQSGDHSEAIRVGEELVAQGHQQSEIFNLLSEAYRKNDQVKEAYEALRRATRIHPQEENNYVDLAALCLDYENYDLGLEITNIGLHKIPNSDRLYLQRGVMRAMKGQVAESEKDFEIAQKLAPGKTLPHVALGIAWMQLGQISKAAEALRQQAKLNPDDFLINYLLGEALVRSGPTPGSDEENEAVRAFEASVRANPDFVHSRAGLGKLLLRRGEVDRAIEVLEKAVELDPTEAAPAFQLANAYRRRGDAVRAEKMMAHVGALHQKDREDAVGKALKRIVREGTPTPAPGPKAP